MKTILQIAGYVLVTGLIALAAAYVMLNLDKFATTF
jgi:hypothetical protein